MLNKTWKVRYTRAFIFYCLFLLGVTSSLLLSCQERAKFPPRIPTADEVQIINVYDNQRKSNWCISKREDISNILEFLKTQKDNWFILPEDKMQIDEREYPYSLSPVTFTYPNTIPYYDFGQNSLIETHGDGYPYAQLKSISLDDYNKLIELTGVKNSKNYPKERKRIQKNGFLIIHCE